MVVTTRAQAGRKERARRARRELKALRRQYAVDNLEDIRTRASIKKDRQIASREIQKVIEGGEVALRLLEKQTEIKRGWYCTSLVTFPLRYEHHHRLLYLNELRAQIKAELPVEKESTEPRRSERVRQQKLRKLARSVTRSQ